MWRNPKVKGKFEGNYSRYGKGLKFVLICTTGTRKFRFYSWQQAVGQGWRKVKAKKK